MPTYLVAGGVGDMRTQEELKLRLMGFDSCRLFSLSRWEDDPLRIDGIYFCLV